MKALILYTLILLPLLAIGQQRWEVVIDKEENFTQISFDNSYDNGIIFYAKTDGDNDLITKVDINGSFLWEQSIKIDHPNIIQRIVQNPNGDILFCGIVNNHAYLFLIDACGNPVWCNEFVIDLYSQSIYIDAFFTENDHIIVLAYLEKVNNEEDIGLMEFTEEGNLLWFHPLNLTEKYNLLDFLLPFNMDKFNDFVIISGFCYYAYPDNPSLVWLRPMFIKTDYLYNEDWFLPYGMQDSISGDSRGAVSYNGNTIHGYGMYFKTGTDTINSILLDFDSNGNETSHIGIENSEIGPNIVENFFFRLVNRDDTSYIASAKFGVTESNSPMGEWIMDSLGNVYQYQSHDNTFGGITPVKKSSDNKFLFAHQYNYSDILFYKLNPDLTQAAIDTNTYLYDSLCPDPILSDTIYLNNCGIITGLEEIQTPEDYYKTISTIHLTAFPNPANTRISFRLKNTQHHKGLQLRIHNINGSQLLCEPIATGQKLVSLNITNLPTGIYAATVSNAGGLLGKILFVKE